MRQAKKAQLSSTATQGRQYHTRHFCRDGATIGVCRSERYEEHAAGGNGDENNDANRIGNGVNEVRSAKLDKEARYYIAQEDDAFGYTGADEVERSGEDYYIEDIVD